MKKLELLIATIILFITLAVSGITNPALVINVPLVSMLPTVFPLYTPTPTPSTNLPTSTSSPNTPTPTSSTSFKKVLALGDSITAGGWKSPFLANEWYPCILKNSLGASYEFVGSQSSPSNVCPSVKHEGYGDETTANFLNTKNPAQIAATYNPDIVLIHLGTNDIGLDPNFSADATINNLQQIVNAFKNHNVNIAVFVSQIIPAKGNWNYGTIAEIDSLNAIIPTITGTTIVDHHTGFDPVTDLFDYVHPTSSGSSKIASKFATVITSLP